ncbi:MAG: TonB-dependent receptor plug domain-containing protein, partial [Chitinophagaceae bacterium]
DIELSPSNTLTLGGGYTLQTVNTTRYREKKEQHLYHAFIQNEWRGVKNLIVIGGLRYDYNTAFNARISPKLAVNYKLNEKIKLNASYGAGFKAPDFRQLYLSFINNAADGYSIYGANEFSIDRLEQQKQQGLIAQILPPAYQITSLNPEISRGFNFGFQISPVQKLRADVNFFRNDIDNLINYIPVATNANGTSVFSYVNINRAFTQGVEFNINYQLHQLFSISGGYQYLETADKDILENINNKEVFGRDIVGGSARLITKADYSGLLNRSKHMANLRLFYDDAKKGWSSSLRFIYRSRFGVLDLDGNGFANMDAEFAKGMIQMNLTAAKQINKQFNIQAGINNVLNQTNARFMPNLPNRNFFIAVHYTFKK